MKMKFVFSNKIVYCQNEENDKYNVFILYNLMYIICNIKLKASYPTNEQARGNVSDLCSSVQY